MHYEPKLEIIVACDASSYGVGACILHKMPDGTKKPIAHVSRTLLPPLYPHWKGGLGNNICSDKISPILAWQILYSTNRPQAPNNHFRIKKGRPIYTANRLQRWGTILLNYNFKIEYLPSKQVSHTDGLSRSVLKYSEPFEDTMIAALQTDCRIKNMIANTIKELPVTRREIKSEAMNDDFITNIKQKITAKNEKLPEVFSLCDNIHLYSERNCKTEF